MTTTSFPKPTAAFDSAHLRPVKQGEPRDALDGPLFETPEPPRDNWLMSRKHLVVAICLSAMFTAWAIDEAIAETPKLRPDQKRAVELSIANIEPSQRPFMYETMAKNLAPYSEAQIALLIQGLEQSVSPEQRAAADAMTAIDADAHDGGTLSKEDFEFNRAQYEPVIRKAHAAQKTFDDYVNAQLAASCPREDAFARWGSGWRYDFIALKMPHRTASDRADIDVEVLGSAYAPQDGRYRFDFSKVRYDFDKAAVSAAVKEACTAYDAQGRAFLAKIDPVIARQDWDGAFRIEQASSAPVEPIRTRLDAALARLSPDRDYPVLSALQNGKRVKS